MPWGGRRLGAVCGEVQPRAMSPHPASNTPTLPYSLSSRLAVLPESWLGKGSEDPLLPNS